jgi:hypothetical protein
MRRRWLAGVLLVACAAGCGSDAQPEEGYARLVAFDTARVRLISAHDTAVLTVELAESSEQQTMGLMERLVLAPDGARLPT